MKVDPSPLVIEGVIRHRLARKYGTLLEKRNLMIKGVSAEFDFVSEDVQIIGQIIKTEEKRKTER